LPIGGFSLKFALNIIETGTIAHGKNPFIFRLICSCSNQANAAAFDFIRNLCEEAFATPLDAIARFEPAD
jgi:hypothetical protein